MTPISRSLLTLSISRVCNLVPQDRHAVPVLPKMPHARRPSARVRSRHMVRNDTLHNHSRTRTLRCSCAQTCGLPAPSPIAAPTFASSVGASAMPPWHTRLAFTGRGADSTSSAATKTASPTAQGTYSLHQRIESTIMVIHCACRCGLAGASTIGQGHSNVPAVEKPGPCASDLRTRQKAICASSTTTTIWSDGSKHWQRGHERLKQ